MTEGFVKIGQLSEFQAGSMKKVLVGSEDALVANVGGSLHAISNKCTHRGGPLHEGTIENTVVICPWHGGQFDLKTGKAVGPPASKDVISFEVKIDGSDVLLKKK